VVYTRNGKIVSGVKTVEVFDWTCPFCGRHATITEHSVHAASTFVEIENAEGPRHLLSQFVVCPNPKCKKYTLEVLLSKARRVGLGPGNLVPEELIQEWQLVPSSKAQSFPDYIPKPILDDYNEACLIVTLSPKASATLSRRCIQGIIRDYWKVKPGRLVDEIEQIKDKVDPLTWQAIEAVRTVGNIGAHMEKDINVIVDVEPQEAELLIGLIEILLRDWYVAREERKARLEKVRLVAEAKEGSRGNTPVP